MIKRCLYNSELQTKALQTEAIQFPFPPQTHSPSLSTLLFVQGGQLVEILCYLASTCVQVMESPRREESEVRLFSPFLLPAGFPQASCVIPPKITLILRSLFPQRSLPSSGQPFLFLFLLRHAASLGSASPWSTACYLVVSLHPPLPLFTAPLLNTS